MKKRRKFQLIFLEEFLQHLFIEITEIKDAHLTSVISHILDNLISSRLAQRKFIFLCIQRSNQIDKSIDRKGIMLGGHRADLPGWFFVCVS